MNQRRAAPIDRAHGATRRTPAGDREDRKAEAAEVLRTARLASGVTEDALAIDAGITRRTLRGMESPEDFDHPPHLDVVMAPSIQVKAIELLARRASLIVIAKLPELGAERSELLRMVGAIQKETADVLHALLDALADGHVSLRENAEVVAQAWEAMAALGKLVQALEAQAAAERVELAETIRDRKEMQ